jgi:hypothetical protein
MKETMTFWKQCWIQGHHGTVQIGLVTFIPGMMVGYITTHLAGFIFSHPKKMVFGFGIPITMHGGGHLKIRMFFLTFIYSEMISRTQVGENLKTLTLKPVYLSILTNLGQKDEIA